MFSFSRLTGYPVCQKIDLSTLINFLKSQRKGLWNINIAAAGAESREFILNSDGHDVALSDLVELTRWIRENGCNVYCYSNSEPDISLACEGRVFFDTDMGLTSKDFAFTVQSLLMQSCSVNRIGWIQSQYDAWQEKFDEALLLHQNLKSFRQNGGVYEIKSTPDFSRQRFNVFECSRLRNLAKLPFLQELDLSVDMFRGGTAHNQFFF
jgi:hypothetical protein